VRQTELRNHLSPIVIQGVADHAADLAQDSFGCQFITEVFMGATGKSRHTQGNIHLTDWSITGDKSSAIDAVAELATGSPNSESHVAATAAGGRMLKTLVAGGHYNNKEKKVEREFSYLSPVTLMR